MRSLSMTSWVLLLALASSAQAADADAEVEEEEVVWPKVEKGEVSAEEIEAFRSMQERFAVRVQELEDDTLAWVERQRGIQLQRLSEGYDPYIEELEDREKVQRGDAISQMEQFLRRWPQVPYASEVRLRLAELHYQDAEEEWLNKSDEYEARLEAAGDDLDLLMELEEEGDPKIELGRVVTLLERIIGDNMERPEAERYELLDVAYYMLAFCFAEGASVVEDEERARATFRQLIAARPDSDYADAAHLLLGDYLFVENDYEASILEFEAVIAKGSDNKHFNLALYQLAWARYKLSEYDEAISLFVRLLDLSEQSFRDTGRASDYQPDAIANLALSLSDQADEAGLTPLERATQYFDSLDSAKPYAWDVYKELAESLVRYARPEDAIDIYRYLQSHPPYRTRPENPDFQNEIVKLLSRGYDADLAAAGEARLQMTELYGEGSDWWVNNRNNPDALAKARRYIEASLREVAVEVSVRAYEANDPELYSAAADKFREYLDKFPIADDYYINQFQLAGALYNANRNEEAAKEFFGLAKNERFHPYGDAAAYMLFRSRERLMREKIGSFDSRPEDAEVERTYTSVGGVEIPVYKLVDVQQDFVDSADAVLGRTFGEPVDDNDFGAIVDNSRAQVMYLTAQMLYYSNRFDEARPRLQVVINQYPQTDEAAYAANLLLNSYITENDNEQIRKWSRAFATMQLGSSEELISAKELQFQDALEKATYQLGIEASERGDYEAAAGHYLEFVDEFPGSKNVPDALLSAALNYERLGRASDSIELYERFLTEFPEHPDAKPFYFRIASNYESTFELEKAIGYYEELVRRFPDYEDSPNALYMVGFLREGLNDNLGAAAAYERYAADYPDVSDREAVHYRAGAQYELADKGRALKFYQKYLRTYGTASPDRAIEAQQRIADIYLEQGRTRDAGRALDAVDALFDKIIAANGVVGPRGRDLAAKAGFRRIEAQFDKIMGRKWTGDGEKDVDLIIDVVPADVKKLDEMVGAFVPKYLSFEYTTACVYMQGAVRAWYADNGLRTEPPDYLDDEDLDAYWALLEEQLFPQLYAAEEAAEGLFVQVLDLAKNQKRHSVWVDRAQAALNDIKPEDYPAVKTPIILDAAGVERPPLTPVSRPEPEPEGEGSEP